MRGASGFTFVEVVFALFLIAVGVIATAPLFVYAARQNAAGGDLGSVGAVAERRMEELRGTDFDLLPLGGSLTLNKPGYFDSSDPDYLVRWTVANNPNPPAGMKLLTVRAVASRTAVGRQKEVTLATVRGR